MDKKIPQKKAEAFLALHAAPPLFVLPNAWDAVTARLFELEGFKAVGTTSAGISASLGYPDGQRISLDEMADVVQRIARCVSIPLSADIERGYGRDPREVARSAEVILKTGAVGVNLEDGTGDSSKPLFDRAHQCERIKAVRETAVGEGIPLVINARIDTYLTGDGQSRTCLRQTIERARDYCAAGANCIFVPTPLDRPGMLDRNDLEHLVDEIGAPVNVLGGSVTLPIAELEEIGIARVSLGPGPMRATLALLRRIARELRDTGTYAYIMGDTIPFAEVNRWFDQ